MKKGTKKKKVTTIDDLSRMFAGEFRTIRKDKKIVDKKIDNLTTLVEDFAVMVAREFQNIREEMATKNDLGRLRLELGGKIDGLRRSMDAEIEHRKDIKTDMRKIKRHFRMSV